MTSKPKWRNKLSKKMIMTQKKDSGLRKISRILLSLFFVIAGFNHFRNPDIYLSMMPPWLPIPETLNLVSGAAEIMGGMSLLLPALRNLAGIGLILLMLAVFPANLYVALHGWPEMDLPQWVLWARLPFQLLFIAWIIFSCPGLFRFSKSS